MTVSAILAEELGNLSADDRKLWWEWHLKAYEGYATNLVDGLETMAEIGKPSPKDIGEGFGPLWLGSVDAYFTEVVRKCRWQIGTSYMPRERDLTEQQVKAIEVVISILCRVAGQIDRQSLSHAALLDTLMDAILIWDENEMARLDKHIRNVSQFTLLSHICKSILANPLA